VKPYPWASVTGGRERGPLPWIFIHDADKVEGDLMVLSFGLDFSVASLILEISTGALIAVSPSKIFFGKIG